MTTSQRMGVPRATAPTADLWHPSTNTRAPIGFRHVRGHVSRPIAAPRRGAPLRERFNLGSSVPVDGDKASLIRQSIDAPVPFHHATAFRTCRPRIMLLMRLLDGAPAPLGCSPPIPIDTEGASLACLTLPPIATTRAATNKVRAASYCMQP